jgi:NADH-quinone oxidoreductase subunit F
MGSYEAKIRLERLVSGEGAEADLAALRRIAADMEEASLCKKGKDTARFILDWMATGAYEEHLQGSCPAMACDSLIVYRIDPEKCVACGLCREACVHGAIHGEKRKSHLAGYPAFEIRQKRCVKCDACRKVCPESAVERGSRKAELVVL